MKFNEEQFMVACGCRSVGECGHNNFAWEKALSALVDGFADAMKKKLRKKFLEGYGGWDDPDWTKEQIAEALQKHVEKGDPVDIANFAAFAWNREEL